jgi:FkbM family methyltransferase
VRIGDHKLWVDLKDATLGRHLFVHREYEPFESALIERAAKRGMNVVDIGANVGHYTITLARRIGPSGRVIAFEPDPRNMSLLRRSLRSNGLANVVCEQVAILDRARTATLYLSTMNYGDHRVFDSRDDDRLNMGVSRARIDVPGVALDDYLEERGIRVNLVKLDIQGAELIALPGMKRTLADPEVILFFEFWPHGLRQAGSNPRDLLDRLLDLGRLLFEIDETAGRILPVDVEELSKRYPDFGLANLISVGSAMSADILRLAPGSRGADASP